MGQLGVKTIKHLEKYAINHFNPVSMGFSPDMQVRIMIAESMFNAYESKRIPITRLPRKVVGAVAETVYRRILTLSQTDTHMAALRDAVGIVEDEHGRIVPRGYGQLTNDIEAYEVLRRMWGMSISTNHAKAVYEEGAMELIELGSRNNNERALAAGLDRLAKLHNDFEEAAVDHANTAAVERDFIADATQVRPDATSFNREEIEEYKRKFGAYMGDTDIEELIQQSDGTYTSDPGEADPADDEDYFERIEREMNK